MQNKIKLYRAAQELTQQALAEHVGVTRQTIIAMEKNKYTPSLELAFRISRIFGVTVEEIFQYDDQGGESRHGSY